MTRKLSIEDLPLVSANQLDVANDRILVYSPNATGRKSRALRLDELPAVIETGTDRSFQQDSIPPTTRADGTPLEIDDRWVNSNDRISFYWDGGWFSEQLLTCQTTGATLLSLYPGYRASLQTWVITARLSSPNNSTNYWTSQLQTRTTTAANTISEESTAAKTVNQVYRVVKDLGGIIVASESIRGLGIAQPRVGSPGNLNEQHYQVFYRLTPIPS